MCSCVVVVVVVVMAGVLVYPLALLRCQITRLTNSVNIV
jgi:hypothetical protein